MKAEMKAGLEEAAEVERQVEYMASEMKERGNLAMKNKDPVAAKAFYDQALELELPSCERAKLLGNRVAALFALKQYDLALADADETVKLEPEWGKAHYRLGCARLHLGDKAGAQTALTRALVLQPGSS